MLDFSSALYLGFRHGSDELLPWSEFSTGVPAALRQPAVGWELEENLARLQGTERALLAPSTLHLFWDLFGWLAAEPLDIALDAGTYPIVRWGVERAASRGARVATFRHHDARDLRKVIRAQGFTSGRVVIVTDGFCPSCARPAPLREYLEIARGRQGLLVIDDTQALGIFGRSPGPGAPYGKGGGGMLRYFSITGPEVVLGCSLAKAFGVPVAALSGARSFIARFRSASETRVHCSPPSLAALHAAEHALRRNEECGERIRQRLARLVLFFRERLRVHGLALRGGLFPVQTLATELCPVSLQAALLSRGIRPVLHSSRHEDRPRLSFLITAQHSFPELNRLVETLVETTRSFVRRPLH